MVWTGCRYEDGGRVRPVLHRASLVEMCVVSPCVSLPAQARADAPPTCRANELPATSHNGTASLVGAY